LAIVAIAVLAASGARRLRPEVPADPWPALYPRRRGRILGWAAAAVGVVLLLGGGATVYGVQQRRAAERWAAALTGGVPDRAPALIVRNGCAGCHTIPGVSAAHGSAGPPLSGLADRAFIGGTLPNTPENLVRWIRDARGVNPRTAMPSTGVPDADARDIAAYLYALQRRP
jgi:cytochrome c2